MKPEPIAKNGMVFAKIISGFDVKFQQLIGQQNE
jgi:hypothetical protein